MFRGPVDLLSVLALTPRHGTTIRVEFINPKWQLTVGDFSSLRHSLNPTTTQADVAGFQYRGRVVGDLKVGRPKYFGGGGGGHFALARIGLRTEAGTVSVIGSDSARPQAGNVRISVAPDAAITSEHTIDDLQRIEPLLARESVMRAVGVEADLHSGGSQRLLVRAGHVRMDGWRGDRSEGFTGELRYSLTRPGASFSLGAVRSPSAVAGAFLPGDGLTLQASTRVVGDLRVIARAQTGSSSLLGATRRIVNKSAATGLQFSRNQTRVTLQAKYAELHGTRLDRFTRTASLNVAVPFGITRFSADLEAGAADHNGVARPYRALRARMGFYEDKDVNFGLSAAFNEYGVGPTRLRLDADAAVGIGEFLIEGGSGYGRGQLLGTDVHSWVSLEAPLPRSLILLATIEHTAWDFKLSPYIAFSDDFDFGSPWRFTVGIRQPLSVVLPFLRDRR